MTKTKENTSSKDKDLELVLISQDDVLGKDLNIDSDKEEKLVTLEDSQYIASRTDYEDVKELTQEQLEGLTGDKDLIVVGDPPEIIESDIKDLK